MQAAATSPSCDAYEAAGQRLFFDGDKLLKNGSIPTATHLFGLAAECAIKHRMTSVPGGDRHLPQKHLPELIDDAKKWFSGRQALSLRILISKPDFMVNWSVHNRYWPNHSFSSDICQIYRDQARRTLIAARVAT